MEASAVGPRGSHDLGAGDHLTLSAPLFQTSVASVEGPHDGSPMTCSENELDGRWKVALLAPGEVMT